MVVSRLINVQVVESLSRRMSQSHAICGVLMNNCSTGISPLQTRVLEGLFYSYKFTCMSNIRQLLQAKKAVSKKLQPLRNRLSQHIRLQKSHLRNLRAKCQENRAWNCRFELSWSKFHGVRKPYFDSWLTLQHQLSADCELRTT